MRIALSLLLLAASAQAAEPSQDVPQEAEPTTPSAAPEQPTAVVEALDAEPEAEPEDRFLVKAEPLGQSDDRTASTLEDLVRAKEATIKPCRQASLDRGNDPFRFVRLEVKLKGDGSIRWIKTFVSSGDPELDACVIEQVEPLVVKPPPMFGDKLELNVTWAMPERKR